MRNEAFAARWLIANQLEPMAVSKLGASIKHRRHDKQLRDLQIAEASSALRQDSWAKEHGHEKRLHDNAIEMERHQ